MASNTPLALLTADILEEIFYHLRQVDGAQPQYAIRENRCAMARAACVCTAFYEPAVKALWRTIPGIGPVLKLLVTFAMVSIRPNSNPSHLSIEFEETIGEISSENWQTFLRYTSYIRAIREGSWRYRVPSSVYVYLSFKTNGQALFPRVQDVVWDYTSTDHLGLLLLASPALKILTLRLGSTGDLYGLHGLSNADFWHTRAQATEGVGDMRLDTMRMGAVQTSAAALDQLLQATLPRCSALTKLVVETDSSSYLTPLQDAGTWTTLAQPQHLKTLLLDFSCLVTDVATLRDLAALANLATLQLTLRTSSAPLPPDLQTGGFPSLGKLSLTIAGNTDPRVLRVFHSPNLHSLNVVCWDVQPTRWTVAGTLEWAFRSFTQLRSLSVIARRTRLEDTASEIPSFRSVFHPLLGSEPGFSSLREVVIRVARAVVICKGGDAELDLLARHLPNLRTLSLLISWPDGDRVTSQSLLSFARHCPDLHTLHLRGVIFEDIPEREVRALTSLPRHGLKHLFLCGARLEGRSTPKNRAAFLQRLFPRLQVPDRIPACFTCVPMPRCTTTMEKLFVRMRHPEHSPRLHSLRTETAQALDSAAGQVPPVWRARVLEDHPV
ncbi:hypothetical protein GY45DRAFT_1372799 [Cubamyces sp. BRFM 1775]|nr:hypothetical protein GY45DRAFT_1372799 [Cubamyces sp. BRFM 1775]